MGLYRDLAKDDPLADGYVSFPRGLDDDYFRQLTSERRTPEKRHGFTVYRWTKDTLPLGVLHRVPSSGGLHRTLLHETTFIHAKPAHWQI